MIKFKSDWNKKIGDMTFPEEMPQHLRESVIQYRRMVMVYGYILHGIGEEVISPALWSKVCRRLQLLQAAWGWKFGFYDFMFSNWSEEMDDHLITNQGVDSGVVNQAMTMLNARKARQRRLACAY